MTVVDTNVVVYFLIDGPWTARAERLRSRDRDWHVPSLFRSEWLNVMVKYLNRGDFDRDEAVRQYRRGLALVTVDELPPDPLRVINMHLESGCSTCDFQFVALAERLGAELVTLDDQVLKHFTAIAVDLRLH